MSQKKMKTSTASPDFGWGRKDAWIPLDIMERFKKDMPPARVIVYDGVGHIPKEEIPEITAKDADEFLSGK